MKIEINGLIFSCVLFLATSPTIASATSSKGSGSPTKGEYQTLDMSEYKKNAATSPSATGVKTKMSCTNQYGQTFESNATGYDQCLSQYEASRNSRELKDKPANTPSPNSVGFTIGK